jgi:hypothetical protein
VLHPGVWTAHLRCALKAFAGSRVVVRTQDRKWLAAMNAWQAIQYGVPWTYLIAGAPSEMWEKVPQAVNLNTWPATLFLGKDGRVRKIHAGFAAPASGKFNAELKTEFTSEIELLLDETPGDRASAEGPAKSGQ